MAIWGKWWSRFLLKMLIFAGLLVILSFRLGNATMTDTCNGHEVGDAFLTPANYGCGMGYTCNDIPIGGLYSTQAEAQAATANSVCGGDYTSGRRGPYTLGGTSINYYFITCSNGGTLSTWGVAALYNGSGTCIQDVPDDSDGDGINDSADPFPDDDSCFSFEKVLDKKNSSGEVVYSLFKATNYAGQTVFKGFGTNDENNTMAWMEINPVTHLCQDWNNAVGSGSMTDASNENQMEINTGQTSVSTDSGVNNNATNSTDTDYLHDIVENTEKGVSNQQTISDLLAGITDAVNKNTIAVQQNGGSVSIGSGSGSSPSASDIGQSVASQIDANRQAEGQAGQDQANDVINGWSDPSGSFNGGVENDVPEKNLLSDLISEYMANNPVSTYLGQSGVQAEGNCSFSWDYKGKQIDFTVCDFQPQLHAWGIILLGVTGLISLMVVVKR